MSVYHERLGMLPDDFHNKFLVEFGPRLFRSEDNYHRQLGRKILEKHTALKKL